MKPVVNVIIAVITFSSMALPKSSNIDALIAFMAKGKRIVRK